MTRKMIFPLLFGIVGIGILVGLGIWQVQRLTWKEGVLAHIRQEIVKPPVPLDIDAPGIAHQKYKSVSISGRLTGQEIHVLIGTDRMGNGFRVISRLETAKGPILVDLGFLPERWKDTPARKGKITVIGNILWPDEYDWFTPEPDIKANIWFSRDLPKMAAHLKSRELLVVARSVTPPLAQVTPLPVDTSGIPNNHLNYAITWFLLAVGWLGMTVYWLWRIRRRLKENS